jgi:site-specific DNA-methyltransferase (adenine-specific)
MLSLHHGDCLEVMKGIPDKSVDLIVCDLPYGCLTGGGKVEKLKGASYGQGACAWDIPIDLQAFWEQVRRIRRDDHTPTIHFCTTKFGYDLIRSNEKEFRYDLVWDKQRGVSFLSANKNPMRSHEMIYVFSKKQAYYQRIDISGNFQPYNFKATDTPPAFNGSKGLKVRTPTQNDGTKRCVLSVIQNANKTLRKSAHPTEKPIDLYKFLIERYSKEGDTILDPTFGSGNSVFTAVELGRNAIGIEKDKAFFDKANARINSVVESAQG